MQENSLASDVSKVREIKAGRKPSKMKFLLGNPVYSSKRMT